MERPTTQRINRSSSPEQKKSAAEAVYESLGTFLFDKVNLISNPFSFSQRIVVADGVDVNVPGVTDTTNFNGSSRITDTAEGKFLNVGRESRMKCNFYVSNPDNLVGYILSPVIYDSFSSLNSFSSMSIFRSYVGVKIDRGVVTAVVKEANKSERNYATDLSFSGTGASDTVVLEIKTSAKTSEVFLNNRKVASMSSDFTTGYDSVMTFLPLLSPVKSYGGTVNITIENYQFIQDK